MNIKAKICIFVTCVWGKWKRPRKTFANQEKQLITVDMTGEGQTLGNKMIRRWSKCWLSFTIHISRMRVLDLRHETKQTHYPNQPRGRCIKGYL